MIIDKHLDDDNYAIPFIRLGAVVIDGRLFLLFICQIISNYCLEMVYFFQ